MNESLRINLGNIYLEEVEHFKYFESVLSIDCYCTMEMMAGIAMAKETFNKNIVSQVLNSGKK